MRTWWRANRAWIAALPVAAALAAGASAYQVRAFWYQSGLHRLVAAPGPGEAGALTQDFRDGQGETSRSLRVRLLGVDPATTDARGAPLLPGVAAYRVRLEFSASPDQELRPCQVAVLGEDGARYDAEASLPCLPEGHPGPAASVMEGDPRGQVEPGEERPKTWQVAPVIETAAHSRIVAVRVWFGYPEYVELRTSP